MADSRFPCLLEPEEYASDLALRNQRCAPFGYRAADRVHLERKTNRHRESSGGSWGWYEVEPIGKVVGYWGTGKDDLNGVDIAAWNERAKEAGGRDG